MVSPRPLGLGVILTVFGCVLFTTTSANADDSDAAGSDVALRDYVVKKGDSCLGIAIRELGDRKAYKKIHQHNKLGPLPHKLVPGSVLKLPSSGPIGPDANLSASRGDVAVRAPAKGGWATAVLGMDLFRRWRVNSRKRSTAEIKFRDTSRLRMRENTVVIVYGPTSSNARRRTTRATLEKGALRTRLAELDGKKPRLVVETSSSETELGSGSALLTVDDTSTARIANHKGKAAKVRSRSKSKSKKRRRKAVAVAPGMGSKVIKDKEPTPPRPLPPTPAWRPGQSSFAGFAHLGATIGGSWTEVTEAAEYRVEIARDADGDDVVADVIVPKGVTSFAGHGFPQGDYHVSIAARDADKFESAPSPWRKISVTSIGLVQFGSQSPLPVATLAASQRIDASAARPAVMALPGSTLVAPDGFACSLGETIQSDAKRELTIAGEGRVSIACGRVGDGDTSSVLSVNVPMVQSSLASEDASDGVGVTRGTPTPLLIRLASEVELDSSMLSVTAEGIEVVRRENQPNQIALTLNASATSPDVASVVVSFGPGGPVLLKVAVHVVTKAVRRPIRRVVPKRVRRWEMGALIGGNLVDDEFELGNATTPAGVLTGSWIVGARFGLHATPKLLLEFEGTYSEPPFAEATDHTNVLGYRGHAAYHLRDGALRPFVLAGFGGTYINTNAPLVRNDSDKEGYWGLGLRWKAGDRSSVRFDVRHRVASGRTSTFSNLFEAALGVGWML